MNKDVPMPLARKYDHVRIRLKSGTVRAAMVMDGHFIIEKWDWLYKLQYVVGEKKKRVGLMAFEREVNR